MGSQSSTFPGDCAKALDAPGSGGTHHGGAASTAGGEAERSGGEAVGCAAKNRPTKQELVKFHDFCSNHITLTGLFMFIL